MAAASQNILPVQQAVLPFDRTTLAAAYVACVDVQEDGICSVIAGMHTKVSIIIVKDVCRACNLTWNWQHLLPVFVLLIVRKPNCAGSALEAELLNAASAPFSLLSGPLLRFKASLLT